MTFFISRDYSPITTGYAANRAFTPALYNLSIFLRKILGYSIVGQKAWDVDFPVTTLTVQTASNTSPIQITTTTPHGLSSSNPVSISGVLGNGNANGTWSIIVTGANTFTLNGSNGAGAYTSGGTVVSGFVFTNGIATNGDGASINFNTGAFYDVAIPISKRKVIAGDIGRILTLKSTKYPTKNTGLFKITGINVGNSTTIAAGSNGQSLPQSTINVASTTGFPTSGTIFITSSAGQQTVTYTGTTSTTFTGCTGGTGTLSTGGAIANLNRYTIDYRATEVPPIETGTLDWWLYENEATASNQVVLTFLAATNLFGATNASPIQITTNAANHNLVTGQRITIANVGGNTAANGTWTITVTGTNTFTLNGSTGNGAYTTGGSWSIAGYSGDGFSPVSRMILQSPHSTGWQVRLAVEYGSMNLPCVSVTTGFQGNTLGDWLPNSPCTHIQQFMNNNSANNTVYNNLTPGMGAFGTTNRTTMVGDDTGQIVFAHFRTTGNNGIALFGIPDNEPTLLTSTERPICYAGAPVNDFGVIALRIGASQNVGMTFKGGTPKFCTLSGWANLDGSNTNSMFSSNATDSVFTGTTELLPIEVWSAATTDIASTGATNPPFFFDQQFMGLCPLLRVGRSNIGSFSITTDESTARTITAATNASPIQITTSAANALVTGQTVTISGVGGNTAANGTFTVTVINNTTFTLDGSTGNGTYTSGGTSTGCPQWIHLLNGIYLKWNGPIGLTP